MRSSFAESSPTANVDVDVTTASRDFLEIPAHKTSADTVLTWEVFEGRYPANALISALFTTGASSQDEVLTVMGGLRLPNEESVPQLVDTFLQNVHTKNPILDVESLVKHARQISGHGFGWDVWSCLVLIACALGSIASRFGVLAATTASDEVCLFPLPTSDQRSADLRTGESYFVLASRRLGALKHTMLGAQCHFYAGGEEQTKLLRAAA